MKVHRTTLRKGDKVRITDVNKIAFAAVFYESGDVTTVKDVESVTREDITFDVVVLDIPKAPRSSVGFTVTPEELDALVKIEEAE